MAENHKNDEETEELIPVPQKEKLQKEVATEEELPAEMPPNLIERSFRMMMSSGPGFFHLLEKFEPEHVTKFLDNWRTDNDNEYNLKRTSRNYNVFYFIGTIAFLVFLFIFLMPRDPSLLFKFIELIALFVGGLGLGIGLKSRRTSD